MSTRAQRLGISVVALCVFALGTVVAGCAGGTPRTEAPVTAPPSLDRLAVVTGGIVTPLVPKTTIPIAGELTATVELRGEPHVRFSRILTVQLALGSTPVADATITIAAHMLAMDHGSFVATALPSGDGRYVAQLPFVMPGEWQLELHVVSSSQSGDFVLDLEDFD